LLAFLRVVGNPYLGIDFVWVTAVVDTSLPAREMLFQMIGGVAQFERSLIAERVKSGLAKRRLKPAKAA
jgi:DNA invertase Pin-like site-specific DNA recombinase